MGVFDIFSKPEKRATNISNDGGIMSGDHRLNQIFGWFGQVSASGVTVNTETALTVPPFWAAVNFISGTLAGLPLQSYRRVGEGRERVRTGVALVLHDAVNDEMSSFEWRKYTFEQVLTGGRGLTAIERTSSGRVVNLWPLDPSKVTIKRENMRKIYIYRETSDQRTREIRYDASEIIDIPFMLRPDGLGHRGPVGTLKDTIGMAIAATEYGSRFFQNGGVPPFAVTGKFQSGAALNRAGDDLAEAVRKAAKEQRQALTLPEGLDIKQIGTDPEKSQLVELHRFLVEQIARAFSIPPTFLQDLTHGTFSNTEQQDLHFVKHTLKRWAEQFEQELNLKIFGRGNRTQFVELNMDGLLRGDFRTRMEGNARAIQTGQLTPNEARRMDNRSDMPGGDQLLIQGATVPLVSAGDDNEA